MKAKGLRYLCAVVLSMASLALDAAQKYDFEKDGLQYLIISLSEFTVGVNGFSDSMTLKVLIPETVEYKGRLLTVKSIEDRAFEALDSLEYVSMPNSVERIGVSAFEGCTALAHIELSDSLKELGAAAFKDCAALDSICWPVTLKVIPSEIFEGCNSLSCIDLGNNLRSIGGRAFRETSLKEIILPETLTKISESAFSNVDSLRFIQLPSQLQIVPSYCFSGCDNLEVVEFPSELREIQEGAFRGCTSLKSLAFPNSLEIIGSGAFSGCSSLKYFDISDGVVNIEPDILWDCPNIETLRIGTALNSLPSSSNFNDKLVWVDQGWTGEYELRYFSAEYKYFGSYIYYSSNSIYWPVPYEDLTIKEASLYFTDLKRIVLADSPDNFYLSYFCSEAGSIIPAFSNADLDYFYVGRQLSTKSDSKIAVKQGYGHICNLEISGSCKEVPYFYQKIDSLILGPNVVMFNAENICVDTLQYIESRSTVPPVFKNLFPTKIYTDVVVTVPIGYKQVYQSAAGWKNFWNIEEMDFEDATAIESVTADGAEATVTTENGAIVLKGDSRLPVEVYSVGGQCLYQGTEHRIAGLPNGVYIVKIGNRSQKIVL